MPDPAGAPDGVRTVTVLPPQESRETLWVVRSIAAIAVVAYFLIGLHRGSGTAAAALESWQVPFRTQADDVQRVYRDFQSALAETPPMLRTPDGQWPEPARLAAELIPPFDAAARAGAYAWELRRYKHVVNYIGRPAAGPTDAAGGPAAPARPTLLLIIEEPDPEAPVSHPRGVPLDEFHRRVDDKTVLHVTIWLHDAPALAPKDVLFPALAAQRGWRQIVTGNSQGSNIQ